jgi:hypothetical protein
MEVQLYYFTAKTFYRKWPNETIKVTYLLFMHISEVNDNCQWQYSQHNCLHGSTAAVKLGCLQQGHSRCS